MSELYRYQNHSTHNGQKVYLYSYRILRETPKGYWVDLGYDEKWVPSEGKKRWAYPTKELAWESFVARKRRHASILRAQLKDVDAILDEIKTVDEAPDSGEVCTLDVITGIDWGEFEERNK